MGYYTLHAIRIINNYNTVKNLKNLLWVLERLSKYYLGIIGKVITDYFYHDYGTKWYGINNDMIIASRMFPKFKSQVKGKGEDGIMWERIYKDGELIEKNDNPIDDFYECEGNPDISYEEIEDEEEKEEKEEEEKEEEEKDVLDKHDLINKISEINIKNKDD